MADATPIARLETLARAGFQLCATAAILGAWLVGERLLDALGARRGRRAAQEAIRR